MTLSNQNIFKFKGTVPLAYREFPRGGQLSHSCRWTSVEKKFPFDIAIFVSSSWWWSSWKFGCASPVRSAEGSLDKKDLNLVDQGWKDKTCTHCGWFGLLCKRKPTYRKYMGYLWDIMIIRIPDMTCAISFSVFRKPISGRMGLRLDLDDGTLPFHCRTTIKNHRYQWLRDPKTIGKPLIPMVGLNHSIQWWW